MKTALPLLGILMALIGVVWFLQGINILPGSFMTGDPKWAVAGVVMLIIGGGLIVYGVRARRHA